MARRGRPRTKTRSVCGTLDGSEDGWKVIFNHSRVKYAVYQKQKAYDGALQYKFYIQFVNPVSIFTAKRYFPRRANVHRAKDWGCCRESCKLVPVQAGTVEGPYEYGNYVGQGFRTDIEGVATEEVPVQAGTVEGPYEYGNYVGQGFRTDIKGVATEEVPVQAGTVECPYEYGNYVGQEFRKDIEGVATEEVPVQADSDLIYDLIYGDLSDIAFFRTFRRLLTAYRYQ